MNRLLDANAIFDAGTKAMESSKFKYATQLYRQNQLLNTALIQKSLRDGTYRPDAGKKFIINERGKARLITSNLMKDKAVNHVICDIFLTPYLEKYLIYDNGASQKGKGVSFHRRRFEQHLREFYRKHGANGYILLADIKGYYASIPHDKCKAQLFSFLEKEIQNLEELNMLKTLIGYIFESFGGDKGIDIGNQVSQNIGILYPYRLDNYAKIVRGAEHYGRYTDDLYAIDESREFLVSLLEGLGAEAKKWGLEINKRKTQILKLSSFFRHLQNGYSMMDTGRLMCKINPRNITREKHKLKAYKRLLDAKGITYLEVENAYKGWLGNNYVRMSKRQVYNIDVLFKSLFRRAVQWPKRRYGRLRWLTGRRSLD